MFVQEFNHIGGAPLLAKYNDSLPQLLAAQYPEYEWLPWKFSLSPKNFWEDEKNQKWFLEWAGKELKIKEMSDWYQINAKVYSVSFFYGNGQ